jgi:translocation and assembly module TamB
MQAKPSLNPQAWLALLVKVGSRGALLGFTLLTIAVVVVQWWAKDNLVPILNAELTKSLKRPVKVGQVKSISLAELRIENSTIPPHNNDLDRVEIEEIVINFDPIKLVLQRTLKLKIKVVKPTLYIDQDPKGNWVNLPTPETIPEGIITTKVAQIEIVQGKLTLLPHSKKPQATTVGDINALVEVDDRQERVTWDSSAPLNPGGKLQIKGEGLISQGAFKVAIQGQKLPAVDLSNLLQIPTVSISQGAVDGNIEIEVKPKQNPRLLGNIFVSNARIAIEQVPRPFDRTTGWLQVSDRDVKFSNVATSYGQIAGLVNGAIDFNQGYRLVAKTARTSLPALFKTIDVITPVPIGGEAVGEVKLTGKLDRPILTGKYTNTQITQIDRVKFDRLQGDFILADGRIRVQTTATPQLGGTIHSRGEIQISNLPQLNFQIQGSNLAGDDFTRLYGAKLPPDIAIGNTSVAGTVTGVGSNLQTNLRLQAPQATYPAVANLQIDPQGKVRIRNGAINLAGDRVQVEGEIDRDRWQFALASKAIDTQKLATITKAKLPVQYRGKLAGNIQINGVMNDPDLARLQASGKADLHLAAGTITANQIQVKGNQWRANVSSISLSLPKLDPKLPAAIVSGNLLVSGNSLKELKSDDLLVRGQAEANLKGGKIKTNNFTLDRGVWQGLCTANNLSLAQFNPQIQGRLAGAFNLTGTVEHFTPDQLRANGNGILRLPQGQIIARNLQLDRGQWRGDINLNSLVLGGLSNQIPTQFSTAQIDGDFTVAGNIKQLDPKHINLVGDGRLKLERGTITARQLQLQAGIWQGQIDLDRVTLGQVTTNLPAGFRSAQLSGNFQAAGAIDGFDPDRMQLVGNGRLNLGTGTITGNELALKDGNWRGQIGFKNFELGQIDPQLQTAKLTGNFNLAGNLNTLSPTALQGNGAGNIMVPGGFVRVSNLEIDRGKLRTNLGIQGLKLGTIARQLPPAIQAGKLNGNYQIVANLQQLTPEQINLVGNGNISNLLGGNVQLDHLAVVNGRWQGKLTANQLNIATLAQFSPQSIEPGQLAGKLSGSWEVAGNVKDANPAQIRVIGNTTLTNFRVGEIAFAPTLLGNVRANPGQGIDITLTGGSDLLSFTLDRYLQPQNFAVRQGEVSASGVVEDKIFKINISSFPIALVKPWIPKSAGISPYRLEGRATGNLDLDLERQRVTGEQLTITNPTFGGFRGDRLVANFQASPQQIQLTATELEVEGNRYLLEGTFNQTAKTPTFQAKLTVPSGKLADLRDLLQIYSVADLFQPLNQRQYGTAKDLRLPPNPATQTYPLNYELQRLSELRRWLDRQAERQQADPIPDLRRLQGDFAGEIEVSNNSKTGLKANFNLIGQKWELDRYRLDLVEARGKWEGGKLALDPLAVTSDQSQIILRGDFGANRQSGQIGIRNLPSEWLTTFVPLPVEIEGGVNIDAQIGGNYQNPQLEGNIALVNGQLNQTPLPSAAANFNYQDGRLDFASRANFDLKTNPLDLDPINITGSIPYQFPFADNPPRNLDLAIDLNLRDRGLQAIDVLSKKQLRWIDGKGQIDLKIKGKMNAASEIETLTANGKATIERGKIQSLSLPDPITDVHGQVVFDFDRLNVEHLEGKFGRGQVQIVGLLPISDAGAMNDPERQLQVSMKGITVNLPEKYQGNVDGQLKIEGTALNPILTGAVQLSQGQVLLPDSPAITASSTPIQLPLNATTAKADANSIQLKNLQVTLGDNLQISRPPLLNFTATGTIDIDGTIDAPRPFGQVKLQKGVVNLFTTQFRLANGYPQTADFFPTLGSDPVLNLRLFAKTLESTSSPLTQRNSIAKTPTGSEINETANFYGGSLGSVQTIQVEARIAGLASQITQRLELSSTPPRTQPEIVLLLGGGLVERLTAGGDNNLGLGLANFASSTLLNNLQDRISDAFSLSDFRLFPTITTNNTTNNTSTLGIAAELGMELTPKLSTSVLKILTNSELPQYGLRYRLNDQMLLRGSTNLFGENRAILEFEQRF